MNVLVVRRLIGLRLRWWALASGRVFLRHWQWFVLAGVLVPSATPLRDLLFFLALPIIRALQAGLGVDQYLMRLGTLQLVAVGWILIQRWSLTGAFEPYLRTLPLTAGQRLLINAAVLVPANTLLLVPVGAALLMAPGIEGMPAHALLLRLAALAALALLAQLAVLLRKPWVALPLALGNLALVWWLSGGASLLAQAVLACALGWGVLMLVQVRTSSRAARPVETGRRNAATWRASLLPPAWRVQCKALVEASSFVRVAVILFIVLAAHVLMRAFDYDGRALPAAALLLAALALVLAGWYRSLHGAHAAMSAYLRALPLPRHFWRWRDLRFIACIGLGPALAVLGPLVAQRPQCFALAAMLLVGYMGLLAALRFPVLRGGRQAALLSVLAATAWSAAAVAATI